jgi:hypothetical protein
LRERKKHEFKPGTLGDRWQSMMIRIDSNVSVGCRCHRVADADFAASDRQYIGYHNDANDAYRWIADGKSIMADAVNVSCGNQC